MSAVQEEHSEEVTIGHFRVHLNLHFKSRLSAKTLLWKSVFIHTEIETNYLIKKSRS